MNTFRVSTHHLRFPHVSKRVCDVVAPPSRLSTRILLERASHVVCCCVCAVFMPQNVVTWCALFICEGHAATSDALFEKFLK